MDKKLLRDEQEFKAHREAHENLSYTNNEPRVEWCMGEPEKYPCICVFAVHYNANGPDQIRGSFVYLDDFEVH
jgi:hypothetical protein